MARRVTAIRFAPDLLEAMQETAEELGVSVNWLVGKLCEEGLARVDLTAFSLVRKAFRVMAAADRLDVPTPLPDTCSACALWIHKDCEKRTNPHHGCRCWCVTRPTVATAADSYPAPLSAPRESQGHKSAAIGIAGPAVPARPQPGIPTN